MTAASLRSSSPALTSAITVFISSLRSATSLLPLERAALEAYLWRASARAGSCNQHIPLEPCADSVHRRPARVIPAHVLICASPPLFEVVWWERRRFWQRPLCSLRLAPPTTVGFGQRASVLSLRISPRTWGPWRSVRPRARRR